MPLTLRDSLEPLTLRDSARYSQNQGDFADYLEASDTNPISRGWTSVSEGLAGSDLLAKANAAERAGDINLSQALELQAMDRMRRAQTWAPTTQSVRDIDGLGSAMEWVGGHVGGGARSMLAPLAGGVGGRVLGGIAGFAIGGPGGAAIGANLGGAAGAFVPSYDMQYNESVGQSMMDPEIRASRSAQDIHRAGQAVGAAGGVLEAIVPAGIAKTAVGGLGKRTIGGVLAREAGEEALTEGAQSLVGQTGQNQLAGRNLTDYDYMEALDAAAAGAVGGAGVSVGGAMVGAARDKLMAGKEKVVETARDPLGAIIQKGYELADKAGRKQARDEIAAGNTPQPLRTMYEEAAAQNADERIFQPPTKDETNEMITSRMREDANRWADRILSAQPRALSPRESELREAAAQFKSDGDWSKLRTVLRKNKLIEERESMMASFDAPGAKASEMTPEGKELDTLSQVWLQNEGKRYGEYFDDSNEAKGLGAKLFAWIKNDFGKSMTEDGEIFIPRAFVDALGERAPGVIESAITAARKEGWAIKDAGDAVSAVKEYVSSNEGDVGALKSAIRYTQEKNWTDKMLQRFAKELRQKNGQLDKDDYKWLKTQVVDPTALLKHFQKPSRFYKAEKNMGVKGDTSLTQAARDQDEKAGITDNDAEWGSGVSEIDPHATRVYPKAGDVEFFDIREADQRAALEKLEKAEAAKGKGSAVLRPVKVGIVDRTLEKIAEERGVSVEALPKQTRDKVMRDLVHEYFPTFERLPAEPKNVNEFTKQQYEKRKAEYAQGLKRRANLLNQKLVALGVDQVAMEKLGTQIEARDVHMKNADPRDPKYGAARGTLILRTYNKEGKPAARPFVTSTQMIVAKMFRAKDSNGASTKRYEGSAQEILQLLSDGVTSVLQDKRFGGEGKAMKLGTLKNGEAQWFDGADIRSWPKNLVIFRGKDNRPYTLGDAIEQEKAQSANTVSFDFDPDDVNVGRNDRVYKKTPWEKRQELKEFLSNGADKPTRAKIVQALRAKGEDGKANNEPVEFLWNELVESGTLKSADVVTEVGTTRGDVLAEGQVGPDDLSAYDPDYIKRDERGDMLSSSTEYSAQSRIGTSKKVDPKDAAKFAPATKATPDRAEDKTKATKREEMRQEFISLLREGISNFKEAVSKMTNGEIVMLDGAYNEFKKQLSDYPHTIAKGYFGGNVDSARMLVSRFKKNMEQIDAAISNRRSEVVNAKGRVERDQVETPGGTKQADSGGKETGVAAQPGRGRGTENRELGAGQQGRNAEDGVTKQDAWVMKLAAMSMKDMRAYINALPAGKLERAFTVLNSFHPADNSNPFWQRNNLDNYTDQQSDVVFEAQDLIRERLSETKYSEQTTGETNGQSEGQNEQAEGRGVETLVGIAGGLEGILAKYGKAFSRRIAEISRTLRFENPNEQVSHTTPLGNFKNYSTISAYVPEQGMFIMYVMPEASALEARSFFRDASTNGVKMTQTLRNRILGHTAIMRLGYDPATNEFVWLSADKGSFGESVLAKNDMLDTPIVDRLGRELNKTKGLKFVQITKLLGEFHARLRETNGGEEVAIAWDRYTGANTEKKGATQFSEQTTSDFKPIDAEKALEDIARMLGKDFDAKVVKKLGGKAGTWKPGIIKLATSAAEGTQFHEALHELFYQMRTNGAANVAQLVERVANSPLIKRKLEQLLSDHPKAIKQLKSPEEAAAYLFQFWNMGLINVGPETKSLFQTIKDLIIDAAKEIHSWINAAKRDERKAEKAAKMEQDEVRRLFEALAGGAAADPTTRTQLYDALRKNVEAHTKKVEELGQRVEGFWQGIGRYVVTSESMLNLYSKHPELKTVADKFHQMAGKSMKNQARSSSLKAYGGLIEAKHLEVQRRLNPFERFLMDGKYDEKDMALAAKHLEANTKSADKKINDLIDFVHRYYGEMYDYMVQSDVRRLDPHSEERWVPIQKRKDYFTQSWSIEELTKDHDGFVSTLLDKHAKELAYMAKQANAEIAAWNKDPKTQVESATARVELDAAREQNRAAQEITPEMIAEQIYVRLLNSTGMVDIQETNWSLGLTPAAGAVNRRELDWLDKEAFSKYKSKDLVEIVTNYTRTMVSRAEYQKRFGYGGEVIGEAMDTAFLREMGGQALVDKARAELDGEVKRWKKEARAWHKDNPGVPFPEPYPTLRLVGVQAHRSQVGAEESNQAMIKAEKTLRPAVNAVRALEGTLGNDISPTMRNVNSWINTYQNVRLLPLALFTNFSDVIGITTNGGTLGDAWNAFTAGMREVRNTWLNEKGSDTATLRAEEWGVSDAGAMLDTLGQNYSSVYMTEKARNINNKFFRIIGMEGWNRGVRITATAVGERIIGDWVKNGVDAKKPGEKARFERLFGEGADPKNIKLDADGNLDTQDAANRAAIQRFVQDSVMSSNSAVRATWMSDPRMATFAHLKNFAYAFHSVMLKGILAQAAEGNLRPALVAGLGFASISIAAAAVKEMLIPGDEPYWMKGGLDGYLEYGYNMANLGGVPQMYLESVTDFDPAKLAGPFWDQIQNTLSSPIPGFAINFSPIDGETEILRDRKVVVELAKALPAGNIAGRAMDSMVGD